MNLGDTVTIELLLNPSETEESLGKQITQTDQPIFTAAIEITPRMRAILLAENQDAFNIQPIHASAEQPISGTDTTKWEWYVTSKKAGVQGLTIAIYRLVKYDNQEYWREVESYQSNIDVKVNFVQRVQTFDWKWIAGFILTFVGSVLGVLTWLNNRNKVKYEEKSKEDKPVKNVKKARK
jgi:hypothetical protein